MAGEFLLCLEVGEVIVIGPYFKGVRMTLEVMVESFEGTNDSKEFFVVDVVVEFGRLHCEEPTTGSFRVRTKGAQDNVGQNRQGRRGGARRIYPREYRRRRGRGCRSECQVDLHLKGTSKEMDEVRSKDKGDDYQGGIDDDEDGKSNGIQVGSWLGRMHKWAV